MLLLRPLHRTEDSAYSPDIVDPHRRPTLKTYTIATIPKVRVQVSAQTGWPFL